MDGFNLSDEQRELADELGLSDDEMEYYFYDEYLDELEEDYELEDDDLWDDDFDELD